MRCIYIIRFNCISNCMRLFRVFYFCKCGIINHFHVEWKPMQAFGLMKCSVEASINIQVGRGQNVVVVRLCR